MPKPPPVKLQLERSTGVASDNRGNHTAGTVIVRPSAKSMVRASSLTAADSAIVPSIPEEVMPRLKQFDLVLFDQSLNPAKVPRTNPRLHSKDTGESQNFAWLPSRST